MRVLVTRPEPAASKTAERLKTLGHEPMLLPLAKAVRDPLAAREALSRPHRAIAVTSAEAIRTLMESGVDSDTWTHVPLFAVGNATAFAARHAGFETVIFSDGDGRALAERVGTEIDNVATLPGPLLYLTGTPRAGGFENRIAELGIPLEACECYRMEPLTPDAATQWKLLVDTPPDAAADSAESAKRLFSLAVLKENPKALSDTRLLCLSRAIADSLPEPEAARAVVSPDPTERSLLELL